VIVVTVMGGLGNQMFQYAFGRAASLGLGRELVLDLALMPTGREPYVRRWELPTLSIAQVRQIGAGGLRRSPYRRRPLANRSGQLAHRLLERFQISDPKDDQILCFSEVPRPIALCVGYWQSHRYFEGLHELIRAELRPRDQLSSIAFESMSRVKSRETIAVHVRRGDYVTDSRVARVHGSLGNGYHAMAVRRIAEHLDRPLAVVFSDDPDWAIANLQLGVETVHAERYRRFTAVETLGAMATCRHHVIANSSLSWWGAYLAAHPDQHVIYPERWFLDRVFDPEVRFPSHWTAQKAR